MTELIFIISMKPVAGSLHCRPRSLSETMTGRSESEICEIDKQGGMVVGS